MKYKRLGNTGVELPEIGFGTWRYQGGLAPLQKAISLEACLIDTAESYGTEEIVGDAIQGLRSNVFLATKVSPRNFRRADLLRAADHSLKRLRSTHIDLYQLHWPNYAIPIQETMGAMEELVDAGKVRFIGVSNFSAGELQRAQAALSRCRIVSNQVRYNLVDRSIELDVLRYCQQHQITIISHSPLAEGLSRIKGRDPSNVLGHVAASTGKTEAQIALNWCISREGVIAIPKASSIEHVLEDCGASGWRLASQELTLLDRKIRFRQRHCVERTLRRVARYSLQHMGFNQ